MRTRLVISLTLAIFAGTASAQLRVTEWNVTNYGGGRISAFQTAIYGVNPANGLSLTPDVIIGQEFLSAGSVATFLYLLNTAHGSPGDWDAAPFSDGRDTDSACFYRTDKVELLGATVVSRGGAPPHHPRDIVRYDLRLEGYDAPSTVLACYSSHMKAGSDEDDQDRRLVEAVRIVEDTGALPNGWHFLLAADLNIRSSGEAAYLQLVKGFGPEARFVDPVASPGEWHNSASLRFLHTQDPVGPGGMDDRYDQILVSPGLLDRNATEYIGNAAIPYSRTTWDDPNHTYRAWGNDGASLNRPLRVQGNTMVGHVIAQSLRDAADGSGHLPVLLELRVPSVVASDSVLDFGTVVVGDAAELPLTIVNAGDVALWTVRGIDDLRYTMHASSDRVTVPTGDFVEPAGDGGDAHVVALETSSRGPVDEFITINSNAADEPERVVRVIAEIIVTCSGDVDRDGMVGFEDLIAILAAWGNAGGPEDLDGDGVVGLGDVIALLAAWGPCG